MSRKADADTQAPLCGVRPDRRPGTYLYTGCHALFDRYRPVFNARYPDFNPETAAATTENLWLEHSKEKA